MQHGRWVSHESNCSFSHRILLLETSELQQWTVDVNREIACDVQLLGEVFYGTPTKRDLDSSFRRPHYYYVCKSNRPEDKFTIYKSDVAAV